MIIAIDYDGTLKRSSGFDPQECAMWEMVITALIQGGWTPIIATMREGNEDDLADVGRFLELIDFDLPVVWCGQSCKRDACRAAGYAVDIWIDDMPESVG